MCPTPKGDDGQATGVELQYQLVHLVAHSIEDWNVTLKVTERGNGLKFAIDDGDTVLLNKDRVRRLAKALLNLVEGMNDD